MGDLHTSSYHAIDKIEQSFKFRSNKEISNSIRKLKEEERKLYRVVECNTYEDFINKLRQLFNAKDIEILQRFQASEIEKYLSNFAAGRGELYQQKVLLSFDTKNTRLNLKENIPSKIVIGNGERAKTYYGSISHDKFFIAFDYNTEAIKTIYNKLFKDRHFLTYSSNMEALNTRLTTLLTENDITINTQSSPNSFTNTFQMSPIPNFPWGCTKKMYEEAVKNNATNILSEFTRATKFIKNYILNDLCAGASPMLRRAVKWAWQKNFPGAERNPAFFFQGSTTKNFLSGIKGAFGEFQASIIFTLLEQQFSKQTGFAKILGDVYEKGEQIKTDLLIIKKLGLQVKNFSTFQDRATGSTKLLKDIETNVHPNKLAQYMNNAEQFLDYLANYYFNTTFARDTQSTYDNIIKVLQGYLGELMNFSMGDIYNTVSFYLISGKYLVPASVILEAAEELNLKDSIEITSSYEGHPDLYYDLPIHKNKRNHYSPLYIEYWIKKNNEDWKPTSKNKQIYNLLIKKRISIRTKFNIFKNIEKYAIF